MTTATMEHMASGIERQFKVPEVMKLTGLSRSFLYGAMDAGRLRYSRFGRCRRVPESALAEWMRNAAVCASND